MQISTLIVSVNWVPLVQHRANSTQPNYSLVLLQLDRARAHNGDTEEVCNQQKLEDKNDWRNSGGTLRQKEAKNGVKTVKKTERQDCHGHQGQSLSICKKILKKKYVARNA